MPRLCVITFSTFVSENSALEVKRSVLGFSGIAFKNLYCCSSSNLSEQFAPLTRITTIQRCGTLWKNASKSFALCMSSRNLFSTVWPT
jgi:hypothetical protein